MEYNFHYTSTHKDLIDGYTAVRNHQSGLSSWSRGAILMLGIMWLLGFVFISPGDSDFTKSFIWLALGVFIIWKIAIKPYLEIKHIKESNAQEQTFTLTFNRDNITATTGDGAKFVRNWEDIAAFQGFNTGVAIGFSDGIMNWIPLRAFQSKSHKEQFVTHVVQRLNAIEHDSCEA